MNPKTVVQTIQATITMLTAVVTLVEVAAKVVGEVAEALDAG